MNTTQTTTVTTTIPTTPTNNNNNDNTISQESSLSFDLDNANPESKPDLDSPSLVSLNSETGFESLNQHGADLCLGSLGNTTRTIGLSLENFDQAMTTQESNSSLDQEGKLVGTCWEPSLDWNPSLDTRRDKNKTRNKTKKRVSFAQASLAYKEDMQKQRRHQNSQLRQLEYNKMMHNKTRSTAKPTQACWNNFQQEQQMQQQPANNWEKKLQHEECTNNNYSLTFGGQSLGSLEQNVSTTNCAAYGSPKHQYNINSLGLGTAWGIMIDTGAAISLAPLDFAQHIELSPVECTLQLTTATGNMIQTFGRRTVQLCSSELCLNVCFVIANVSQTLIGMADMMTNNLSLLRGNLGEYCLVNLEGARTQLLNIGQHLYLEACPVEPGFSIFQRSSFPTWSESLLDSKDTTQDEEASSSGGALQLSIFPEALRQQQAKNNIALGTPALPEQGAQQRKKKEKQPSASSASQAQSDQRSLEQKGQQMAVKELRSLEKTRIINEINLAAREVDKGSLESIDLKQLSLRILSLLSLRNKWMITTMSTKACSEDALGQQLRDIGLEQNQLDPSIFSGDELVILMREQCLLVGGTELQQECLFTELSALASLQELKKLAPETPVSFGNMTLEFHERGNTISLRVESAFYMELLKRHNLKEVEPTTSLQQDELTQPASGQDCTLEAENQELFSKTVGDLEWLARACRPDLSFVIHSLTQSFEAPTKGQEMQLRKVLAYLKGTQHYSLSLHPQNKITQEEPQLEELVAFSSTSWTGALEATSTASLNLWGACLIASCKTSGAQTQELAELESLQLALALASWTRTFLQQLALDKLGDMHISLRTTSWKQELVQGRPLATMLGLSRRNRHIELDGQLRLSRVPFHKNLAHSLSHNAPEQLMLAKLKIDTEAEEALALSTVRCPGSASFSSCSSLVGMILVVPPQMASKLRQLALQESCDESLPKPLQSLNLDSLSLLSREECSLTFESLSFTSGTIESLILHSLTLIRDRLSSSTLQSLSFREGNSQRETLNSLSFQRGNSQSLTLDSLTYQEDRFYSLTLPSLSLREDSFQKMSFKEDSFHNGRLEELEDNVAHKKLYRRAGTNSFSKNSFAEKELAQEVGTNNFEQSLTTGILSFRMCLQIFGLSIFLILCAALGLRTCFSTNIFHHPPRELTKKRAWGSLLQEWLSTTQLTAGEACGSLLENELWAKQLIRRWA